MAAKFDGKHARANMWVTHQNLARAKGGRPHRQFKERSGPPAPKAPTAIRPHAEQTPADAAPAIAPSLASADDAKD